MCSVKPPSHMAGGQWPGTTWGLALSPARDPSSGPAPCPGCAICWPGADAAGAAGRGGAGVNGGRRGRPAPGVCLGTRATTLRAGRGQGQSARTGEARAEGPARDCNRDPEQDRSGSHGVVRAGEAAAAAAAAAGAGAAGGCGAGRPALPPGPELLPAPARGPAVQPGAQDIPTASRVPVPIGSAQELGLAQRERGQLRQRHQEPAHPPVLRLLLGPRQHQRHGGSDQHQEEGGVALHPSVRSARPGLRRGRLLRGRQRHGGVGLRTQARHPRRDLQQLPGQGPGVQQVQPVRHVHGVQGVPAHPELHPLEGGRPRLRLRAGEDDGGDLRQRPHQLRHNGDRADGAVHRGHLCGVPGAELHQPRRFRGGVGCQRRDRVLDRPELVG